MRQILETGFSMQQNTIAATCNASSGIRALTSDEIEQVGGGLPFVITPVVIKVATWGAGVVGGVFLARGANDLYDDWFGEACSM